MPVRKFLDLSTTHLPYDIGCNDGANVLNTIEGVVVYDLDVGWLLWVPGEGTDVNTVTEHNRDYPDIPMIVRAVQDFARSYGCDYVLLDRDGPVEPNLPSWEW